MSGLMSFYRFVWWMHEVEVLADGCGIYAGLLGAVFRPRGDFSMGHLRDRMEEDLKLRGLSPCTRRNYLLYCRKFAAFFMRSPEELGAAEVRAFLLHQIEVEQLAYASYRQVYAALKFLYSVTIGRPGEVTRLPFPRRQQKVSMKNRLLTSATFFFLVAHLGKGG